MATDTHYRVGKTIRDTIKQLGGTMPEDLPTPEKSIKEIEKEKQKSLPKTCIKWFWCLHQNGKNLNKTYKF